MDPDQYITLHLSMHIFSRAIMVEVELVWSGEGTKVQISGEFTEWQPRQLIRDKPAWHEPITCKWYLTTIVWLAFSKSPTRQAEGSRFN